MDPDANLQEQITLANGIIESAENETGEIILQAIRLAELVLSLDEWLTHQGFPTERWMR